MVPVLVVRSTALAPELVMAVVPVTEKLPALVSRVIPAIELFVEVRLCKITSIVPLLRLIARPEPLLIVVSRTLSVPYAVPVLFMQVPVVVPKVAPQIWLFEAMVISLALAAVIVGFVPPVAGRRFIPDGAVNPVIVS